MPTRQLSSCDPIMQRNGVWRRSIKRHSLNPTLLSSQIGRSASFNSSGHGSNCEDDRVDDRSSNFGEEGSDISLEEDVSDLTIKVRTLERQLSVLSESRRNEDERYTRSRQENGGLQERLIQLEDQLEAAEKTAEHRLEEERWRHRQQLERCEREHQLRLDNIQLRVDCLEKELSHSEQESSRLTKQLSQTTTERDSLQQRVQQESERWSEYVLRRRTEDLDEQQRSQQSRQESLQHQQTVSELTSQLQHLTSVCEQKSRDFAEQLSSSQLHRADLDAEVRQLRQQNHELRESCDELHVQLVTNGLQEGKQLLQDTSVLQNSLADELQQSAIFVTDEVDSVGAQHLEKCKTALRQQQEDNVELRRYIDGILLSIVEHHPELLEVKRQT